MPDEKVTKLEANYSEGQGQETCGNCQNFLAPDGCQVVAGTISPSATCALFSQLDALGAGAQQQPFDINSIF